VASGTADRHVQQSSVGSPSVMHRARISALDVGVTSTRIACSVTATDTDKRIASYRHRK
jgi:hypothetical protein